MPINYHLCLYTFDHINTYQVADPYGEKASLKMDHTKGKNFRHEKTKVIKIVTICFDLKV